MDSPPLRLRLGRGPFVGRRGELDALADALEQARASRAGVVLLAGEPGIGKTRLLEEFPSPSPRTELILPRGGSSQAEGMPPCLPFLEALGEYAAVAPSDALRADLGAGAASVARLVPEVEQRLGALAPPPSIPPQQERLRLFEAVAGFVGAIAARARALVLVLDDLHWADAATCSVAPSL
jgi:predicted ATPase